MKAAHFAYAAPETIEEAVELLASHGDDARVLAGGQSLVPMMALRLARFELLVDITRIAALRGVGIDDGRLRIGATTLQATALQDAAIASEVPLLAEATTHVGHFQTRNRGTIGGALAHADPAAEYPAVALALGAEFEVAGPRGVRTVAADELYDSSWTTTLREGELIVASRWPRLALGAGAAIAEVARRHGDFALVGAVASVHVDGAVLTHATVVTFAVAERPQRMLELEAALAGSSVDLRDLDALATEAAERLDPPSDVQASGSYRRRVARVLIRDVVRLAVERAGEEPG